MTTQSHHAPLQTCSRNLPFFLHFMCESNGNLSRSAEIQGGKSLLGSTDFKFRPVHKKNGQALFPGTGRRRCRLTEGVLGRASLCVEVPACSGEISSDGRGAAEPLGRCLGNQHSEEPGAHVTPCPDPWLWINPALGQQLRDGTSSFAPSCFLRTPFSAGQGSAQPSREEKVSRAVGAFPKLLRCTSEIRTR